MSGTGNTELKGLETEKKLGSILDIRRSSSLIYLKQDIASTKNSYQFLVPKVPVLRRNRATNSSNSTDPFSAATKAQVIGNLFKLARFAITFAREVCHWG